MIKIREDQINRVELLLADTKNGPQKAFYNAINRGLTTVRTKSAQYAGGIYAIKKAEIKKSMKVIQKNASQNLMIGSISFSGNMIPLYRFKVTPSSPKAGTVKATVIKGQGATINSAYVTDLGQYGPGVFERLTSKRETSEQLYGPSVAHMIEKNEVLTQVEKDAQITIDKRIEHEITRILNKY